MLVLILSVLATVASVGALANWIAENAEDVFSGAVSLFSGATVEGVLLGIVIGFAAVYFLRKNRMARKARAEENAAKAEETETVTAEPAPLRRMNERV